MFVYVYVLGIVAGAVGLYLEGLDKGERIGCRLKTTELEDAFGDGFKHARANQGPCPGCEKQPPEPQE